jgi:purine-binding chemotaxis protein CheW
MNGAEPVGWTEARGKIAEMQVAIEIGFVPTPEQETEILKERAKALAEEPKAADVEADWLEVVEFDLAGESYALPLSQVREVSLLKELTPVPCTPPFVLGIINLRGEIRVVIDLKKFFNLPEKGITDLNKIIIIQNDEMQLGILADSIRSVRRVRIDDLQPALPTMTGIRVEHLRGVTSDRVVILDSGKILSDKRIIVDEQPRS